MLRTFCPLTFLAFSNSFSFCILRFLTLGSSSPKSATNSGYFFNKLIKVLPAVSSDFSTSLK